MVRHLVCLMLGVVVGLAAVIAHRSAPPWGLLLSAVASLAAAWWLLGSRHPRLAGTYAAGWVALLAYVVAARPEGDFAVAADLEGYALLATGALVLGTGIVGLVGGRLRGT